MNDTRSRYDVVRRTDVMVPMRDGVRLATDLYFPAVDGQIANGRLPALIERTPYDKVQAAERGEQARYFASRGYIVVFQDVRGRFASEGTFTKYLSEPDDGYDTLVWIGDQPWSNGKVGTFGISYGAHTQAALAALDPPNLACCFMDSGGFANAFDNSCRLGGAFELRQATWAYNNALTSPEALADPTVRAALEAEDIHDWFTRMPWRRGHSPLRWVPEFEDYLLEMWTRSDFDDYWKQPGICNELYFDQYADVPMVHMGSWYDPYTRTTTRNYTGLSELKQSPIHLILGPWTHGAHDVSYSGDVDFGPQSVVSGNLASDYNELRLRWFDRCLKEADPDEVDMPAVSVFVMGGGDGHKDERGRLRHGGRWHDFSNWPPPTSQPVPWYLHADGSLSQSVPAIADSSTTYQYDPRNPVPTVGGNISSGGDLMVGGAFDQGGGPRFFGSGPPYLPLASRHDVLVFQSEPLRRPVQVIGPIEVTLWASSSAPDTDFTAKLINVHPPTEDYPQGFDMNLTDGIIRARYRNGFDRGEPMKTGEIYEFKITLYPTANLFDAGHRIRMDISSSNFPRLDVNPNTGEPLGLSRLTQTAVNTIYHDAGHPSHVTLPITSSRSDIGPSS